MNSTNNQHGIVAELREELLEATKPVVEADLPTAKPITEFSLGEDNGGNLLGERWLCRGGGALLWGPSGVGKSALVMQLAVRFALGEDFFGLCPVQALRVLIIQAENDAGDITEQSRHWLARLTEADRATLATNLQIVCLDDKAGTKFLPVF